MRKFAFLLICTMMASPYGLSQGMTAHSSLSDYVEPSLVDDMKSDLKNVIKDVEKMGSEALKLRDYIKEYEKCSKKSKVYDGKNNCIDIKL